ncbi:protein Wnt-7b isoform X2 [Galleria mellonella]|uniref:Protein Wnt n=1 Tax=Galleria mellonella TaxID=7137 RepID=A0ABM3MVQ2_GALME|nr:protein Wnt-7b isoform X2 [Galleria mellonella]
MVEWVRRASTPLRASTATLNSPRGHEGALLSLIFLLLYVRSGGAGGPLLGANLVCARGLTDRQRAMCHAAPAAVAALGTGLSMAYKECRAQLSGYRWNCSGVGDGAYFGHVMPLATREAAFTYAITAAGATHALSAACARGDLPACGCAHNSKLSVQRRRGSSPSSSDQFQWGGCGEVAFGARFARRFLDARELEADARSLMNLHNNRVGRKTVKELVRRECKCHGVSGSCAVRTCWRALPPFAAVARALRERYRRARRVAAHAAPPPRTAFAAHVSLAAAAAAVVQPHLVLRRYRPNGVGRPPRKSELVYLAPSPSYCEPDAAAGSPGTHGRHCNRTSRDEDGCEKLCCGRGYNTVRVVKHVQCRCQFHWCCKVTCDTCLSRTETHVCE